MSGVAISRLHAAVGLGAASMLAVSGVVAMGAAHADQTYYVPASKTWTISGHGYGHGHGMSQYGAQGAALKGLTYTRIVKFYYPGTSWAKAKGKVRVLITADYTSDLQVRPRPGLRVRDLADGSSWLLPRGNGISSWRMLPAAGRTAVQYRNGSGWHRWTTPNGRKSFRSNGEVFAPGPVTMVMPSGALKAYRGTLRIARPSPGSAARDTINVVTMDTYVQGVVPYEMPTSWQQQALRAQSVAARTYAAWQRAQSPNRYYQICDTTACQVYGGVAAEQTSTNTAVQATAGRILTYGGKPAFTQFSASSGGWTSAGGVPYLPAQRDPYDGFAGNYVHDWSVEVSAAALERAYPAIGRLISARVTKRDGNGEWNGRVLTMVLEGTNGRAHITGDDFRWKLGLRSTWFSIAPTAIISRWRQLGAAGSLLGSPTTRELAVGRGAIRVFEGGRIYWSAKTGAREVRGRLLNVYRDRGGPESHLRWPVSGVLRAANGGYRTGFQGGRIYAKPGPGAHVVFGHILSRWGKADFASGWMGYPTTDVYAVDGGRRCKFQHATITWERATDTFTVRPTD